MLHWIKNLITLSLIVTQISCSNNAGNESNSKKTLEESKKINAHTSEGSMMLGLNKFGFPLQIMVPDSAQGALEIEDTGYGTIKIQVGRSFAIKLSEGGDIELKKESLALDQVYSHQFLEQAGDYFVYESIITESYLKPEYHFYMTLLANGVVYEIQDDESVGVFAQSEIESMLTFVKQIKVLI